MNRPDGFDSLTVTVLGVFAFMVLGIVFLFWILVTH